MNQFKISRRAGFTLAELLVVVALVAIAAAIVLNFKRQFSGAGRILQAMQFSPDGNRVVGLFSNGSVNAWNVSDGKQVQSLPGWDDVVYFSSAAISPDGRRVAHVHYDVKAGTSLLTIRDLATGDQLLQATRWMTAAVAFSHDGKWLAVTDPGANELKLISVDDVDVETKLAPLQPGAPPGAAQVSHLAFHPDDTEICYSLPGGEVVRWNLKTQRADRVPLKATAGKVLSGTQLSYSPDGETIAIAGIEMVAVTTNPLQFPEPESRLKLLAANDLRVLEDKLEENNIEQLQTMPAGYSPPSFAVSSGSDVKIVDARTLETLKSDSLENEVHTLAVRRDGKLIAAADFDSIYLLDGSSARKLVDYRPQTGSMLPLFLAFAFTFILFATMRKRRKIRTCVQCGKKWLPTDKLLHERCPECRVLHQTTEQIAKQVRQRKRRWLRPAGLILLSSVFLLWLTADSSGGSHIWNFVGSLLVAVSVAFGLIAVFVFVVIWSQNRRIRKYRSTAFSVAAARKAAACDGRMEEFGPITLWTDAVSPLPVTAESIAAEFDNCRRRVEELTGEPCPPVRPLMLVFFSRTASANGYVPIYGVDADQQGYYLGPNADLGYVSLAMLRRRLTPLLPMVRSLMLLHLKPARRGIQRFWLRHGLDTYLADYGVPAKRDSWRRTLHVLQQEGGLLTLETIFRQRKKALFTGGQAALLPENAERMLKIRGQLSSLVDYLCGDAAPPERRQQFVRLWQGVQETGSLEKACAAVFAGGLAQLESDWKAWAATVTFGPPLPAPPEIAEAAAMEVIPLVLNAEAPTQERIKRIRSLGACGWLVGIEPLRELLKDLRPDIRREAQRGLQFLLGNSNIAADEPVRDPKLPDLL